MFATSPKSVGVFKNAHDRCAALTMETVENCMR